MSMGGFPDEGENSSAKCENTEDWNATISQIKFESWKRSANSFTMHHVKCAFTPFLIPLYKNNPPQILSGW